MDGGPVGTGTAIALIFLLIKAFITACEVALANMSDARMKKQTDSDDNTYNKLDKLMASAGSLKNCLSILRIMTAVIVTVTATITYFSVINYSFWGDIQYNLVQKITSGAVIIAAVSIFMHIFGYNIPKNIALKNPEKLVLSVTPFLSFIKIVFAPISKFDYIITLIFSKMFGFSIENSKQKVTEEEILMMVDAVNGTGALKESQKEMINNIFEFDDLFVSDVMTHRTNIVAVDKSATINELVKLAISNGFSRIPIYDERIDNIIGVVHIKDLLVLLDSKPNISEKIDNYIRDIKYVPQTNHCAEVFKMFTSTKTQIAVVVDEYGGTAGLVTMEDLLEEIVGNIQDEYDNETEEIIKTGDNTYQIIGEADPAVICKALSITMPDENMYDTMGGFIIDMLGHIPSSSELPVVSYQGVDFKVLSVEDNAIALLEAKLS